MSAQVQLLRLDLRLQVIDPSFPRVFTHSWRAEGCDKARRGSKDFVSDSSIMLFASLLLYSSSGE